MNNKRRANLTPPTGTPAPGIPPTRRAGGTRFEASDRLTLTGPDGVELTGWALNISRGGLRAVVEEHVELGVEFAIAIGDEPPKKRGRVVWIQEEPDGAIVGIEFLGVPSSDSAAPPPPPGEPPTGGGNPAA